MRCAALHAPRDMRVIDAPDPVLRDGECLVRITGVGICGSDIHWFREGAIGDAALERPLVLGHEMAGIGASGPMEGQTVGLESCRGCSSTGPNRSSTWPHHHRRRVCSTSPVGAV